jgi:hypothetical protein
MSAKASPYATYEGLIVRLKEVIRISQRRVTEEPPDLLLIDNLNFFTKAYLISLCTYLEAFLQDIAFAHVNLVQSRVASARIPNNVVHWCLSSDVKEKDQRFADYRLAVTRGDLANELSGNPGKTISLFRNIGVDLRSSQQFQSHKEIVGTVVAKRNSVIHHNDNATDVSMADLLNYADQFLAYMRAIEDVTSGAS